MTTAREHLASARKFANLLDARWSFLGIKFGIDPIFDIIPGITPLISLGLSCYLLYIARLLKVPGDLIVQMIGYIVIDYVIGSIPVIGFIGDIFFKSNLKNLDLLEAYIQKRDGLIIQEGEIL